MRRRRAARLAATLECRSFAQAARSGHTQCQRKGPAADGRHRVRPRNACRRLRRAGGWRVAGWRRAATETDGSRMGVAGREASWRRAGGRSPRSLIPPSSFRREKLINLFSHVCHYMLLFCAHTCPLQADSPYTRDFTGSVRRKITHA